MPALAQTLLLLIAILLKLFMFLYCSALGAREFSFVMGFFTGLFESRSPSMPLIGRLERSFGVPCSMEVI